MRPPDRIAKERPLLFSGPMVRAILAGAKTQTRRIVKDQPPPCEGHPRRANGEWGIYLDRPHAGPYKHIGLCPHGEVGDRLWVRESFAYSVRDPERGFPPEDDPSNWDVVYRESGDSGHWRDNVRQPDGTFKAVPIKAPWKPSIHMPRRASRITLEITDVRVERVRSITPADALAEGIAEYAAAKGYAKAGRAFPVEAFAELWDEINAARGFPWAKDPWVWVVSFNRLEVAHASP